MSRDGIYFSVYWHNLSMIWLKFLVVKIIHNVKKYQSFKDIQHHLLICTLCSYTFNQNPRHRKKNPFQRKLFVNKLDRDEYSSYQQMYQHLVWHEQPDSAIQNPPNPVNQPIDIAGVDRDPAEERQDPAENRQDPAGSRQDPAENRQDPAENRQDPAENRQDPDEDSNRNETEPEDSNQNEMEVDDPIEEIDNENERFRQSTLRQRPVVRPRPVQFPTSDLERYQRFQSQSSDSGLNLSQSSGQFQKKVY